MTVNNFIMIREKYLGHFGCDSDVRVKEHQVRRSVYQEMKSVSKAGMVNFSMLRLTMTGDVLLSGSKVITATWRCQRVTWRLKGLKAPGGNNRLGTALACGGFRGSIVIG